MSITVNDDGFDSMLQHCILSCDDEALIMMDKVANEVLKNARKIAKIQIDTRTGRYLKSWKSDKSKFSGRGNLYKIFGSVDNKAHLLEDGHRGVDKNGREYGFVSGYQVLKHAMDETQDFINTQLEEFVNNVIG